MKTENSRLTSRSTLHLLPEDVAAGAFPLPFYARVVGIEGDEVKFRSFDGEEGALSRSVAARRTVTIAAVNKMGRVSLLRRPVAVTTGDPEPKTFHGQVVGVEDGEVTHVALDTSEWSSADVDNMQTAILSRNHPEPSAICKWVDPQSGSETQFPLQHAVDYAFYIDGEAGGAPAALGESFCRAHDEYVVSTGTHEMHRTRSPDRFQPLCKQQDQNAANPFMDALIVARLSHDPELLDRFLNLREQSRTQASSASADDEEKQPLPPLASPCKAKSTTKKSKYAFSPQRERQESLPGVLTRAYDYQFDIEGLSIMHFSFMDRKKRMEWIDSGSANFSNFSATADFEPAPAATSINDVVGAVLVFQVFAREYCVTSAIELVDAIIGFIEAKIMALRWEPEDIPAFVYWAIPGGSASARQRGKRKGHGPIPPKVLQKLPKLNDSQGGSRRLCMRFLSNAGCDTDLHEGAHDGRAHFVPKTLDALVKAEIEKRFDGLKPQYKHL
ncbi:hypothetical protein PHYSODRAFT_340440 [Phytophthora sojae]|uniref:Uncharacterized protein n=1 Tax=Phytophthora sojae (strain P6497) TaxID=1094619 RepID=G5A9Q6_PHYSP|nr:hypothetical protein PHYSODRAFT_340440 [Phytophthora sojae]EGZ07336.1 hypothetical protein PHYSODRAFT_340440 [Phytophthora sojae]|eukprot:XP_009536902.1 hypothetical protein PHYSODRAFT_340440 [Phytophthora sojae]